MNRKTDRITTNRRIDENLRRVYHDALEENLPDTFLDLIRQLKEAEKTGSKKNDDE